MLFCSFAAAVNDSRYFIVATGDTVARVSLDGLRYQVLVSGLGNAVAIDYDYRYSHSYASCILLILKCLHAEMASYTGRTQEPV